MEAISQQLDGRKSFSRLNRVFTLTFDQKKVDPCEEDLEQMMDYICLSVPPFYKKKKNQNLSRVTALEEKGKEEPTRP
jgi:hypothetical protein